MRFFAALLLAAFMVPQEFFTPALFGIGVVGFFALLAKLTPETESSVLPGVFGGLSFAPVKPVKENSLQEPKAPEIVWDRGPIVPDNLDKPAYLRRGGPVVRKGQPELEEVESASLPTRGRGIAV